MNNTQNKNGWGVFLRTILKLVIPIIIQNCINAAISSTDVIMLGKVNDIAIAASSLVGQIQYLIIMIFFGINSGAAILVSQYWGKEDADSISQIVNFAWICSMSVAVLFFIGGLFFPQICLSFFTNDLELLQEGAIYFRIISFSFLLMGVSSIYLSVLRCIGRVKIATILCLISFVINFTLNYLLIYGNLGLPKLGSKGAAIATLFSRFVELIVLIWYSSQKHIPIKIKMISIRNLNLVLIKDFIKYSIPVMCNEFLWSLGGVTSIAVLGHIGVSVISANSVVQTVKQLATIVVLGVANSASVVIGQRIGGGEYARAQEDASRFLKITLIIGLLSCILINFSAGMIVDFVNLTNEAEQILVYMLRVMSYYVVAQAFTTTIIIGILRPGGDVMWGIFADLSTIWGVSVLMGWIALYILRLDVIQVYIVIMADEIIKAPIVYWRYRKKCWLNNLTRNVS